MEASRIGIGIPCLVDDKEILEKYCLSSINNLNPAPHEVFIYFNNGVDGGMLELRDKIFDELFINRKCDIVLVVDVDFRLIDRGLLNKVKSDMIVTFLGINKYYIASMIKVLLRNIVRKPWSGCYSIPKHIYYGYVRNKWDGTDSSVHKCVNNNFESIRYPGFIYVRRNMGALLNNVMKCKGLRSKIMRLLGLVPF